MRMRGKVSLITGAARGQGRSHAIRLAEEGADIIALDICRDVETVPFPGATHEDMAETVALVEALGRRIVARAVDVRDLEALTAAVADGVGELSRLDTVVINHGITSYGPVLDLTPQQWGTVIDVNLTGVWNTMKAAVPTLVAQNEGGSVIVTGSVNSQKGVENLGHYTASKHGIVGLARVLAKELAATGIRVNCVYPGTIDTPMVDNATTWKIFRPDLDAPTKEDGLAALQNLVHLMPVAWIDAREVSNGVLWLASDESRFVTGISLPIDAGALIR